MLAFVGNCVGLLAVAIMNGTFWLERQLAQCNLNDFGDVASIAAFLLALWLAARNCERRSGGKRALARPGDPEGRCGEAGWPRKWSPLLRRRKSRQFACRHGCQLVCALAQAAPHAVPAGAVVPSPAFHSPNAIYMERAIRNDMAAQHGARLAGKAANLAIPVLVSADAAPSAQEGVERDRAECPERQHAEDLRRQRYAADAWSGDGFHRGLGECPRGEIE